MQHVKPPRLDVEPTIALAHAEDWARYHEAARRKPLSHDVMKTARAKRSVYQRELIARAARSVVEHVRFWRDSILSPPAAPAKPHRE